MGVFKNLKNRKFGRLKVLKLSDERLKNELTWVCKCDCGNIKLVRSSLLLGGNTRSCGCLRREMMSEKCKNNYGKYRKDLKGKNFGRLKVIKFLGHLDKSSRIFWECVCDCGKITKTTTNNLMRGQTKSCGCLRKERQKERVTKHNMSYSKEYHAYHNMLTICYNVNDKLYKFYGGLGIKVCDEWKESFENFLNDMGHTTNRRYSFLRKDKNKGYYKENCYWGIRGRVFKYKGEKMNIKELSKNTGINYNTLYFRLIKYEWPLEKALKK